MILTRDEVEVRVARQRSGERWPHAVRVCIGYGARIVRDAHRDALVNARAPLLPIEIGEFEVRDEIQQAGETSLCYDGQNYFDVDHPVDKYTPALGVQKNLFKGLALTPDNYSAVRTAMMSYVGEDGQPLGVNPKLLVVPPQLEQRALQILHADFIAPANYAGQPQVGSNTNVLKGTADVLVIPQLANDPNAWYLLDVSRAIRPFIFQLRSGPMFVQFTDPKSENVFRRKKFIYGVDARGNAGYGLWFLAAKATAAV